MSTDCIKTTSALGEIRTHTDLILSQVPLPLGYMSKTMSYAGIEPAFLR